MLAAFLAVVMLASCSHKINPARPNLGQTEFRLDSVPVSEINVPIRISMKPLTMLAEKNVDTLFTSAGYPDGWVQEGCDTRYKYVFRRGPLQMKASGSNLNLGFTGYYKIVGSTRACVMGAAVSPWTPPCRCGFDEPERRVNVSFTNTLTIAPDYKARLTIRRNEPQPLDKCEVCFWGQDITGQVMNGLKAELDAAKADMDKSYGVVDLKPRFQQVWDQLNRVYNVYGMGWLQMNPQRMRVNSIFARNDTINLTLGLLAKPVISFEKPGELLTVLPSMYDFAQREDLSVYLDAVLNYDSLSGLLNQKLANREFDFNKGPVRKKFVIKNCQLSGEGNERLIIRIDFAGSNEGVFYLTGKPAYDRSSHVLEIRDVDFDVQSRNTLLKSAEWLFNKRITNEIARNARFDLTAYLDSARLNINQQLNREWMKGIRSAGSIREISLEGIFPFSRHLLIRANCKGSLAVQVDSLDFSL